MDKHHLLRRPAGSSIHGCNICGKEGHRAADCPNGSAVNWVERFGPNWTVDVDAIAAEARREPDYDALAKRAKAYAERKLAELEGGGAGGEAGAADANPGAEGAEGGGEGAERAKDAGEGDGDARKPAAPAAADWRVFYDQQGRPYYHNSATGQTQWTPPTV